MSTYLVRTVRTLRLVGIFVAKTPADLFCIIDLDMDPFTCEFLKLQDGEGISMDGQFAAEIRDEGLSVSLELVDNPVAPQFTDRLAERLDNGRSWNAFTTKHFADGFDISLKSAEIAVAAGLMR